MSSKDPNYSSYWRRFVADTESLGRAAWLARWGEGYTTAAWRRGRGRLGTITSPLEALLEVVATKPRCLVWWFGPSGRLARRVLKRQGRRINASSLNAVHALDAAKRHLSSGAATVCVIGDGLGFLSACLLQLPQVSRVILVNLEEMQSFDRWGLELSGAISPAQRGRESVQFVSTRQTEDLMASPIDMFFNLSSFQEMTSTSIATYFSVIRRQHALLYCMNREQKVLEDEGPIRFDEYPWTGSKILESGSADWHWTALHWSRPFVRHHAPHRFSVARF